MLPQPHSQTRVTGRQVSEHSVSLSITESLSIIEDVKKFMNDFSWAGIGSLYYFLISYREQHDRVNKQSGNSATNQHNTLPNMPILTADTARPSPGLVQSHQSLIQARRKFLPIWLHISPALKAAFPMIQASAQRSTAVNDTTKFWLGFVRPRALRQWARQPLRIRYIS